MLKSANVAFYFRREHTHCLLYLKLRKDFSIFPCAVVSSRRLARSSGAPASAIDAPDGAA